MDYYTVDEKSPCLGQPKSLYIELTKYQKAMLYKTIEIEGKYGDFGIMGDCPGTGKTAVMLGLILSNIVVNKKEQSLIIVPQNLLSQWENEIKKFCKDVKYFLLDSYSKVVDMYSSGYVQELRGYTILLAPSSLLSLIKSVFNQVKYNVKRVIYDEIDTLEGIFDNIMIKGKVDEKTTSSLYERQNINHKFYDITWLISASIINLIDVETGEFKVGDIEINKEVFDKRFIKCKQEFIDKYTLLKNNRVDTEKIVCDTILDKFSNVLSIEQLDNINSLSFTSIHGEYIQKTANKDNDVIPILINDYISHYIYRLDVFENLSKKTFEFDKDADNLDKQIKGKISSEIKFYKEIINEFFVVLDSSSIEEFTEKYNQELQSYHNEERTKQYKLKEFFKEVKQDNTLKVLLFSDYTGGFNILNEILDDLGIKYTDLGKGNIKEIDEAIFKYKKEDIQVLMIDSSSQGCGMNLENSTHVVFIHKAIDTLYEQIIGRALRPGRTRDLKVKIFLNRNEIV
jgi:SNF2 family DNA or RNA helicase